MSLRAFAVLVRSESLLLADASSRRREWRLLEGSRRMILKAALGAEACAEGGMAVGATRGDEVAESCAAGVAAPVLGPLEGAAAAASMVGGVDWAAASTGSMPSR